MKRQSHHCQKITFCLLNPGSLAKVTVFIFIFLFIFTDKQSTIHQINTAFYNALTCAHLGEYEISLKAHGSPIIHGRADVNSGRDAVRSIMEI